MTSHANELFQLLGKALGCVLLLLPFLFVILYVYIRELWKFVINQPERYREWNRRRKEWNKTAAEEKEFQRTMLHLLDKEIERQGLSEEDRFIYAALV
jgi:hypothetical protein